MENLGQLQSLDLEYTRFTGQSISEFVWAQPARDFIRSPFPIGSLEPISGLVELKSLNLTGCRGLTGTCCCGVVGAQLPRRSATFVVLGHRTHTCPNAHCLAGLWAPGLIACFFFSREYTNCDPRWCFSQELRTSNEPGQTVRFTSKNPPAKGD